MKRRAGVGEGGGTSGTGQFVRGNYKYFLWRRGGAIIVPLCTIIAPGIQQHAPTADVMQVSA